MPLQSIPGGSGLKINNPWLEGMASPLQRARCERILRSDPPGNPPMDSALGPPAGWRGQGLVHQHRGCAPGWTPRTPSLSWIATGPSSPLLALFLWPFPKLCFVGFGSALLEASETSATSLGEAPRNGTGLRAQHCSLRCSPGRWGRFWEELAVPAAAFAQTCCSRSKERDFNHGMA